MNMQKYLCEHAYIREYTGMQGASVSDHKLK